jgi:cholesterol 7-dehydrogenase
VAIEGTTVIPPGSHLRKWPVVETNGGVFVWHDADNGDPTWSLEPIDDINSGRYYCSGKTWCHVNAHVQELPENGPDAAHLNVLHRAFVWRMIPVGVEHLWSAEWKPHPTAAHKSLIHLTQRLTLFGCVIPGTFVDAKINQIGPGIVMLHLKTPVGQLYAFEFVTPSKTTTQIVQHTMFCSGSIPRWLGKIFLWSLEEQFQRDAPIWETKKFLKRPVISKADGPILAFRRWYAQFYSSSSVTFPDALAKESMMDW